jgi:hypothetical protein
MNRMALHYSLTKNIRKDLIFIPVWSKYIFQVHFPCFGVHLLPCNLVAGQSKVKVKIFLCLTKHHAINMYWGVEV